MSKIEKNNLKIDSNLYDFVNNEVIPKTGISIDNFWSGFDEAVHELAPVNDDLIKKREEIQKKIDDWHKLNKDKNFDQKQYKTFLKSIDYIVDEGTDFNISTSNVDEEIALIAGPQLVVPVDNARYALNAANARWGSLYDALYGTDAILEVDKKDHDLERAKKVVSYVRKFLSEIAPIESGNWAEVTKFTVENKELKLSINNKKHVLKNKDQFIGFNGEQKNPKSILIKNNNLHIDIIIDSSNKITWPSSFVE